MTNASEVLCKYEGEWKNDKRTGQGLCIFPNGDLYQGKMHNDKRHGQGTYQWKDGRKYEGE